MDGFSCLSHPSNQLTMKKSLVRLIVYATVTTIVVLGVVIANNLLDREHILERITEWPDLQVNTLEGEPVSTMNLLGGQPMMLYYFSTECIFCQGTFSDLPNHPELTKTATLVFISDEDPEGQMQFLTGMEITELAGPLFYHDHERQVKDFYAIRAVPAIYLYDQEGKLIQLYRGAVGLREIGSRLQMGDSSN
jgi:hypothetical protein